MSLYTYLHGYYKNKQNRNRNKQNTQKIASIGKDMKKVKPLALLMGMQNGAITAESSIVIPHKIKYRIKSNSTSDYVPKRTETETHKNIYTHIFIAALFTIANRWKQTKCLLT